MSLNCNEINLVLEELNINGYFIQDIIQPGYDTIAFYLYANGSAKTVLICTAQNACRLNETRRKIVKNEKPLETKKENQQTSVKKTVKNTEIKDEDMMVAALIATIDYTNETKKDVRLVSIKQIR